MDGKTLADQLYQLLLEDSTSDYIDAKTTYDNFYEAACEWVRRTRCITSAQTITTVALQSEYDLSADFFFGNLRDDKNRDVIKYNDGTNDSFLTFREWNAITYGNDTTAVSIPYNFSITDKEVAANITGTATSDGTASNGECTLTNTGGISGVTVGDDIHNTNDGSHGKVIEITSTTAIKTALFYGTNNDWTSADAYTIVPQAKKQLVINPPPSASAHTITVYYVQKPLPVYSLFRSYRIDDIYAPALVKYAAWLYKYRDSDDQTGDAWYKYFDNQARMCSHDLVKSYKRNSLKVNLQKRSLYDRSYR